MKGSSLLPGSHRCWAEVDLSALRENLAWIQHCVGPGVKIMTVVKADAYGHGLKQIAALLMQSGTDIFGVANLTEAHAIRSVGQGWPILLLGACLPEEIDLAVRDDVMPSISSADEAIRFSEAARRQRKTLQCHVKVDTGMGRLGVAAKDALALVSRIGSLSNVHVAGVFTHYSSVEDDKDFSRAQAETFGGVLHQLQAKKLLPDLIHANNSAALLWERGTIYNLVRPGLLVYGILPPGMRRAASTFQAHIRPALSLRCRVTFIKEVPKGTPLSYGRAFIAPRRLRVATLSAGYADGFSRAGSNRAEVLVRGKRCRVLGRVTMDQTLVDVSRVPSTAVGDEAVLIGKQGNNEITVNELAEWCGTVPWEVLTNITYRVPRIYRGGQAA